VRGAPKRPVLQFKRLLALSIVRQTASPPARSDIYGYYSATARRTARRSCLSTLPSRGSSISIGEWACLSCKRRMASHAAASNSSLRSSGVSSRRIVVSTVSSLSVGRVPGCAITRGAASLPTAASYHIRDSFATLMMIYDTLTPHFVDVVGRELATSVQFWTSCRASVEIGCGGFGTGVCCRSGSSPRKPV
jgi:hypothetical protein